MQGALRETGQPNRARHSAKPARTREKCEGEYSAEQTESADMGIGPSTNNISPLLQKSAAAAHI